MRQFLVLLLVLALLLTCAVGSVLLARGWFTLRTASAPVVPPAPTTGAVLPPAPQLPTPTPAAGSPGQQPAPIGGEQAAAGFDGTFAGTLSGGNGTSAPATLVMSRSGDAVSARLEIGQGLSLDAGNCGTQAVPALSQTATGTIDPANPNRLTAAGSIPVAGFTIGVALAAELGVDGQTLAARADLDLPMLCGRDAAISGEFARQ